MVLRFLKTEKNYECQIIVKAKVSKIDFKLNKTALSSMEQHNFKYEICEG